MISTFILQLLITFLCFSSGFFVYRICKSAKLNGKTIHFTLCLFNGLVLLTAIAQTAALFSSVNIIYMLPIFILLLIINLIHFEEFLLFLNAIYYEVRSLHTVTKVGIMASWLLLLLLNSGPTLMDDTESYHIQMIKWLHEYGTVPGLANLHERYGFNSSWFNSIALFTFPSNFNYYNVLNGTIVVWFISYLWQQVDFIFKVTSNKTEKQVGVGSLLLLLIGIAIWSVIRSNASNANYDFITTAMVSILFIETFKYGNNKTKVEWLIWPVFLFTVRIINYPLLILSIAALIFYIKSDRFKLSILTGYIICVLLMVLPFLIRNILLSGYPFYPSLFIDWFEVDWKADPALTNKLLYFIKYFNRVNSMFQSIDVTAQLEFPKWTKAWLMHLFTYDKIILVLSSVGFLSSLTLRRQMLCANKRLALFFSVFIIQLLSWLFIAPDPRFIYGLFLCGIFLLHIPIFPIIYNVSLQKTTFLFSIILISLNVFLFVSKLSNDPRYRNWILPFELPKPALKKIPIGNVDFFIPEKILNNWNSRCYATQLPCLYIVHPSLHLRGSTIEKGFSIK